MTQNAIFFDHIRQVLNEELTPGMSEGEYLRLAADWFSAVHAWQFLRRPCLLDIRARVDLSAASYVHATRTLTLTGAFVDWDFVAGDQLVATGGTGVVTRHYPIESRVDDDSIVLAAPGLGAAADAQTDIEGHLLNHSIALPSDFMAFAGQRPLWSTSDVTRGVAFTSPEVLTARRASVHEVDGNVTFLGVITELLNPATGKTEPVLEIHPGSSANVREGLQGYYRARLVIDPTSDQAEVPLPVGRPALELVLIKACRAFALGLEEGEEVGKPSLEDLLARLTASDLFRAARKQDGLQQPNMGPLRGGVGSRAYSHKRMLASEVDGPS